MLSSFLKSAFRNFRRYRLYTFINITGLAIAVALSILIYLYIRDEFTYDAFHSRKDRIYRVEAKQYVYDSNPNGFPLDKDHSFRFAWMPTPLGPVLKEEIPDVLEFTRYSDEDAILSHDNKVFNENIELVDPGFLKIFDFELIEGHKNSALNDIHDVVITASIAKKYFGDEDPVGKTLQLTIWNETTPCTVTGIVRDPPGNSSFRFRILARQELRPFFKESEKNWNSFSPPTFIQLAQNTDMDQFRIRLDKVTRKYFGETIADVRARQNLDDSVKVFELTVNPLVNMHLDTKVSWYQVSDITYSYILGGIGLLIFIIACLNYISLSVSSAAGRSTEIGIRKVLGAGRSSLARQFWGESQLMAVFSVFAGILLAMVLIEPFNRFAGKSLSIFSAVNAWFYIFLLLLVFLTGLFAGSYPALFLSGFQPVDVLKKKRSGRYNLTFTRGLVVLQYALSGILITSSLIMFRQMKFVTNRDLGYNKEQIVVLPTFTGFSDDGEKLLNRMKNELISKPGIISVTGVNSSFNRGGWSKNSFKINDEQHAAYIYRVDPDYVKTLGMQIIMGRDFRPQSPYDTKHAILVNEALVRDFGWEDPVGRHLYWRKDSVADEIIGVVKDYYFLSLTQKIEPAILALSPEASKIWMIMVKIAPDNIPGNLARIEKTWGELNPDKPFDYTFLDSDVDAQYSGYRRWMSIMGWATGLAIFIACLGLFGLAGISTSNRTREISIRKVFGAGIANLFVLLNREVIGLAVISFVLATPVSWYFMHKWLASFAYHIGIPWMVFAAAVIIGMLVAVATVSYHSIRTALVNPAEILKDE